jgi:hypothetical protein
LDTEKARHTVPYYLTSPLKHLAGPNRPLRRDTLPVQFLSAQGIAQRDGII